MISKRTADEIEKVLDITSSKKRYIVIRFDFGWAVWDRFRHRVSDGIYVPKHLADEVAEWFNREPSAGDRDWLSDWTRY